MATLLLTGVPRAAHAFGSPEAGVEAPNRWTLRCGSTTIPVGSVWTRARRCLMGCVSTGIDRWTARPRATGGMILGVEAVPEGALSLDRRLGWHVNHDLAECRVAVHDDIPEVDKIFLPELESEAARSGCFRARRFRSRPSPFGSKPAAARRQLLLRHHDGLPSDCPMRPRDDPGSHRHHGLAQL